MNFCILLKTGAVYKALADPGGRGWGVVCQVYPPPTHIRRTKIYYLSFRTALCFSDSRHYSGSLLPDLGVTSLIIVGAPIIDLRGRGGYYYSTPLSKKKSCSFRHFHSSVSATVSARTIASDRNPSLELQPRMEQPETQPRGVILGGGRVLRA